MSERAAEGQRALVTAGAGGIGRAIVEALHAAGARVHLCDVDEAALAELGASLPQVSRTRADVAVEADVDRLFEEVRSALGGLDVLVNNAGIAGPTAPVEEIDPAEQIIVYCRSGGRSLVVAEALQNAGYDAKSMAGGILEWERSGHPVER